MRRLAVVLLFLTCLIIGFVASGEGSKPGTHRNTGSPGWASDQAQRSEQETSSAFGGRQIGQLDRLAFRSERFSFSDALALVQAPSSPSATATPTSTTATTTSTTIAKSMAVQATYAEWSAVASCEEGGFGHYGFPAYPDSLGISAANWYGNGGDSDRSPSAQVAVAQRLVDSMVGEYAQGVRVYPGWVPDQRGCASW